MLGSIIGAAGSLLGGLFGESGKRKEIAAQKEFAQHGIRWRVEDAKEAGVHPLYALGAQTHSFAPVGLGDSMANALGNAGQEIGRAVNAKATMGERHANATLTKLQLQRAGLENELLATQIRKLNQPGNPPPLPADTQRNFIPGQGNAPASTAGPLVVDDPLRRVVSAPGAPHAEPGHLTDVGYIVTKDGGHIPVPSEDAKSRLEDSPGELEWYIRHNLLPRVGVGGSPPAHIPLPHNKMWVMQPDGAWYQVDKPQRSPEDSYKYLD